MQGETLQQVAERRVRELRQEGMSDVTIVEALSIYGSRKLVKELIEATRPQKISLN